MEIGKDCDFCVTYLIQTIMSEIHQAGHTELLTAFHTIYYQLVHSVQEAVTGHAETNRLSQLGNSIDEFNEQVQQVSDFLLVLKHLQCALVSPNFRH